MSKNFVKGFTVSMLVAAASTAASADEVLLIDLTVPNQITATATSGLSGVTASGTTFTGFLLENFYNGAQTDPLTNVLVSGNLTTFNNPTDNSPSIFRDTNDPGLNFWSYTAAANSSFTAGVQALTGSGTWSLNAAEYADMLGGNLTGNLYFPADTSDDIGAANLIGTWRVIPAPGTASLLGVGLIAAARRRRA